MRRLIILLVVVGALGVGADIGARQWAEGQVETRARAELPSQVSVSAHVRGFPFLLPLLIGGRVSEADGHFENVPAGSLTLASVDIELHGVRVNRNKLLKERKVELVGIDEGTVSVEIAASVLTKALGLPVQITNGQLKLAGAAVGAVAKLSVEGNALVINVAGIGVRRIPIPKTRLVPCVADVTVLAGRLRLSCTIHNVPPALLGEANVQLNG